MKKIQAACAAQSVAMSESMPIYVASLFSTLYSSPGTQVSTLSYYDPLRERSLYSPKHVSSYRQFQAKTAPTRLFLNSPPKQRAAPSDPTDHSGQIVTILCIACFDQHQFMLVPKTANKTRSQIEEIVQQQTYKFRS